MGGNEYFVSQTEYSMTLSRDSNVGGNESYVFVPMLEEMSILLARQDIQ